MGLINWQFLFYQGGVQRAFSKRFCDQWFDSRELCWEDWKKESMVIVIDFFSYQTNIIFSSEICFCTPSAIKSNLVKIKIRSIESCSYFLVFLSIRLSFFRVFSQHSCIISRKLHVRLLIYRRILFAYNHDLNVHTDKSSRNATFFLKK